MYNQSVNRDAYIFIETKWKHGFTHIVPCRGYSLKSQLAFNESLFWIESSNWREVTQSEYEEHIWGTSSAAGTEKTTKTSTTRSRSKNGQSTKTDGKKHSATKQSATTATKSMRKKASSSTRTKKQPNGSLTKENSNGSRSKRQAQQENPSKGKRSETKGEDRKAVRTRSKESTRTTRSQPSELREPKVRNVRKPKKDIQGADNPREEVSTGHGKPKRQTKQRNDSV